MRTRALAFEQKGLTVNQYFERWKQRAISHAAWLEACRQSDSYRKKSSSSTKSSCRHSRKEKKDINGISIHARDVPEKEDPKAHIDRVPTTADRRGTGSTIEREP
jgi:hypothetical protein